MTNDKQQTEINAVEYIDKVNQFAKENNTDKPRQQTAIEWLWNQLPEILPFTVDTETAMKLLKAFEQAKEMEKEQIIEAFWNGDNTDCTSEQNIKDFAQQYYKQTYGGGEQ